MCLARILERAPSSSCAPALGAMPHAFSDAGSSCSRVSSFERQMRTAVAEYVGPQPANVAASSGKQSMCAEVSALRAELLALGEQEIAALRAEVSELRAQLAEIPTLRAEVSELREPQTKN